MKECTKCHETKAVSQFYIDRRRKSSIGECKQCIQIRTDKYRAENLGRLREAERKRRRASPEETRARRRLNRKLWYARNAKEIQADRRAKLAADPAKLERKRAWEREYRKANKELFRQKNLRKYGLTIEQRDAILASQGGGCAICGTHDPVQGRGSTSRLWHTDHCHQTGRVRGVLCSHCNRGLGSFKDNPDTLRAAIAYLAEFINESDSGGQQRCSQVAPKLTHRFEPLFLRRSA